MSKQKIGVRGYSTNLIPEDVQRAAGPMLYSGQSLHEKTLAVAEYHGICYADALSAIGSGDLEMYILRLKKDLPV